MKPVIRYGDAARDRCRRQFVVEVLLDIPLQHGDDVPICRVPTVGDLRADQRSLEVIINLLFEIRRICAGRIQEEELRDEVRIVRYGVRGRVALLHRAVKLFDVIND